MSQTTTSSHLDPLPPIDLESKTSFRGSFSTGMDILVALLTILATVPLFSLLYMVIYKGLSRFRFDMLWELPPGAGMEGGGFGNAIVGTLALVAIAAAVSVPLGILTAVFLTEYARGSKIAQGIRFASKILSGLPSILAGVFIYAVVVLALGSFSVLAGGLALAVLMLPIIVLSAEEALLRVPRTLRDASTGLGATTSQTVLRVTLPACAPSLITGVMLAVARAAGETAPVMFTALFSDYWISSLFEQTASLSMIIYNFAGMPFENMLDIAWSASLVLILLVLATNIVSHLIAARK
ncbi:MAG: phosphate ABC transporter permease PstA [Verrucomicrobiota bacterium]